MPLSVSEILQKQIDFITSEITEVQAKTAISIDNMQKHLAELQQQKADADAAAAQEAQTQS